MKSKIGLICRLPYSLFGIYSHHTGVISGPKLSLSKVEEMEACPICTQATEKGVV